MGLRFIFMLTRDDRTVEDAESCLEVALKAGIRHVGFKDVGLPVERLKGLARAIREAGATSYLEVVSLDTDSEVASARAAVDIGVDVLLGGVRAAQVLPVIEGSAIQYFPFPGRIVGHPSILTGSVDEIVDSAVALASLDGVHGLDLLAYRSNLDGEALIQAVCDATAKPVIVAGSIASPERIRRVRDAGAAGFTIGTAAISGRYPADGEDLGAQLEAIVKDLAVANNHISPFSKKSLASAFSAFQDPWSPRVAGQINDMQLKLAKLQGEFLWHFHPKEDELFLVHKGRLKMRFRDRDEVLEEGDFIVVPHGVEHCPVAMTEVCEVVLLEPGTTVNTGTTQNERTVSELGRV